MLGKAVKVRHCPATVTGKWLEAAAVTAHVGGKNAAIGPPEVRRPVPRK